MNATLLVIGLLRSVVWVVGAVVSFRERLLVGLTGCVLACGTSLVFSFANAGAAVPRWLLNTATILAVPTVVCIVGALLLNWWHIRIIDLVRRRWRS